MSLETWSCGIKCQKISCPHAPLDEVLRYYRRFLSMLGAFCHLNDLTSQMHFKWQSLAWPRFSLTPLANAVHTGNALSLCLIDRSQSFTTAVLGNSFAHRFSVQCIFPASKISATPNAMTKHVWQTLLQPILVFVIWKAPSLFGFQPYWFVWPSQGVEKADAAVRISSNRSSPFPFHCAICPRTSNYLNTTSMSASLKFCLLLFLSIYDSF